MAGRIEQFQSLVARQPENELFRFSLAQALLAAGRGAEAVPHLERCVQQRADWMMPRILLGRTLIALGRRPDARPLLEEALQLAIDQRHEEPEQEIRGLLGDLPSP